MPLNVMDFFKKPAAPTAPATTPPATNTPPANSDPNNPSPAPAKSTEPNPNDPSKTAQNPLDVYTQVFDNAAKSSEFQAPSFSLDPAVIAEVSSKMNFAQGINPELMQKATNGDAAAMIALIQDVARNAYRASLEHATKLTDTHLGQRSEFDSKRIERDVLRTMTNEALVSGAADNTNYNHPIIKAELNRIAKQLAASPEYADASPREIAEGARKYFKDLQAAMNPTVPNKDKSVQKEVDYLAYLTGTGA